MYKKRNKNSKQGLTSTVVGPGIQNNFVPTLANTLIHPPIQINTGPRNANCLASFSSDAIISTYSHAGGLSPS